MSGVQRWTAALPVNTYTVMTSDTNGEWMKYADHARIVAEERAKNMPWTCGKDGTLNPYGFACIECIRLAAYEQGKAEMEQAHAAALADMYELGKADGILLGEEKAHRDSVIVHEGAAELRGYKRGLAAAAPRTLTADDAGYHSQRCLHCDHIRAAHSLTAYGCIGHAVGACYCPCSEFIHDGEATP